MIVNILDYEKELQDMEITIYDLKQSVIADIKDTENKKELCERIGRCEWYIQGQIYHLRNMIGIYKEIVGTAINKMNAVMIQEGPPSFFFTANNLLPNLYYELYAFINLFRISLDYFHKTLEFKFEKGKELPKSFSAFTSRTTDCPILERLANDYVIMYFKDFRDCLNHYRTFSANSMFMLVQEDIQNISGLDPLLNVEPFILKPSFRIEEDSKIIINFYLPDVIFEGNKNKLVKNFTYEQKKNILAETMSVLRHVVFNFLETLTYINKDVVFHYDKNKFEEPVEYIEFMG
ncbi:MAG: hypothetical protein IJA07_00815 [Agathobacter sp.]|nr:hypothetical protein [Agathobacter sp.]